MTIVSGDLLTVLIVDLSFFGAITIVYFVWLWTTGRSYLKNILIYASLSNLARAILALMLMFNFSLTTRSDGIMIFWLRWLFLFLIWGTCGVTHAYAEMAVQTAYYKRWIVSLILGLSFVGPWVASDAGSEDQRIVALSLSAIPYVAGIVLLWVFAHRRDFIAIVVLSVVTIGVLLYALFYALGHSGWSIITLVWETAAFLILDAILIALGPAVAAIIHCPHVIERTCKKDDDATVVHQLLPPQFEGTASYPPPLAVHEYGGDQVIGFGPGVRL